MVPGSFFSPFRLHVDIVSPLVLFKLKKDSVCSGAVIGTRDKLKQKNEIVVQVVSSCLLLSMVTAWAALPRATGVLGSPRHSKIGKQDLCSIKGVHSVFKVADVI